MMRLKGHIWESRGDMFWVWRISRCCNVARSWCPPWKCWKKCVSLSCNLSRSCHHLLEMDINVYQDLAKAQDTDTGFSYIFRRGIKIHSKHTSSAFPVLAHCVCCKDLYICLQSLQLKHGVKQFNFSLCINIHLIVIQNIIVNF